MKKVVRDSQPNYDDIITDRLILRPSNDDRDLENYLSHLKAADEFYYQYGEEYSDELYNMIDFHSSGVIYYSVFLKEQNIMVGYVGVLPYQNSNAGEIEFYIFKEYRRNHYASEALTALIEWFMSAELNNKSEKKIVAETLSENEISCKLLEHIGFDKSAMGIRFTKSLADNDGQTQHNGIAMTSYEFTKGSVKAFSRDNMEWHIRKRRFPHNTDVICFYDPDGTHIDYSGIAEDVICIPLADFQTDLPQADMIADFVRRIMKKEHNIICQCEKGQSRSAGCAAAIMEYYYKDGQSIFDNEWYSPDEMIYYAVLNALDKI